MMTDMLHNITAGRWQKRLLLALSFVIFHFSFSAAQIEIDGNVYGGGNAGNVDGKSTVTVCAGDVKGNVFGGARMADVGGRTFVHVDGEHASDYVLINKVFGGNDMAGTIGTKEAAKIMPADTLDFEVENHIDKTWDAYVRVSAKTTTNGEGETVAAPDAEKVFIGQLFGSGNGEYNYSSLTTGEGENATTTYTISDLDGNFLASKTVKGANTPIHPDLAKTYLELVGGTIGFAYGGGNNATVTGQNVVCVANPSKVVNSIKVKDGVLSDDDDATELLDDARFAAMGINVAGSHPEKDEFQMGWVFGGNNKADMRIMPKWNLKSGSIRNLYSGGNAGRMTSPTGILLEIFENSKIIVDNVFGGCRKANVEPLDDEGNLMTYVNNLDDEDADGNLIYHFPPNFAARTLIRGGDVNNVYGGNDISGKVYFGNALGVYTTVRGDVYGGGNGSYAYTDNANLADDPYYGEYYYNPETTIPGGAVPSVEALNAFRPNADQVSLRVAGKDENHPAIIGGRIFVGGNSASLKMGGFGNKAELKIGSHVIADQVFLGNNGENMVKSNAADAENGIAEGVLRTMASRVTPASADTPATVTPPESLPVPENQRFNSMDLTDPATFAKYLEGCSLEHLPSVVFDDVKNGDPAPYEDYKSYFGSFYCGGNVGSMTNDGLSTIDFSHKVIIFNKLVGGCNNAYVPKSEYNAVFDGGLIGAPDGNGDKLVLNLSGLKLQPKRWAVDRNEDYSRKSDANGQPIYLLSEAVNNDPTTRHRYLEWNTVGRDANGIPKEVGWNDATWAATGADGETVEEIALRSTMKRRFEGGNIYGGCYTSGYVNGNVVININGTIVDREGDHGVFATAIPLDEEGNEIADHEILYGHERYSIPATTDPSYRSGVILDEQGMDALGTALNVFGGGYGEDSEIKGSTTINLNRGYTFQIFGGGEMGAIGKGVRDTNGKLNKGEHVEGNPGKLVEGSSSYSYNSAYSTTINMQGIQNGLSRTDWNEISKNYNDAQKDEMAECEFIYGGGFEGLICGDTRINLGNGRVFNTFAGSCDADVLGHTETYVGQWTDKGDNTVQGFPWVRDHIYGGNDLGGSILGSEDFYGRVTPETQDMVYDVATTTPEGSSTPVTTSPVLNASSYMEYIQGRVANIFGGCYGDYDYDHDPEYMGVTNKPYLKNTFVNIRPTNETSSSSSSSIEKVFGGGQGCSGYREGDKMQDHSYVLIDIPQDMENFKATEVFGSGMNNGLGMRNMVYSEIAQKNDLDGASAIVDLARGQISAAYGGSYNEGVTRRTVVNVPAQSTIQLDNIFGGAYGTQILPPCDVYEANVNYNNTSELATVGKIFGGNNSERRTLYAKVNISSPVWSDKAKGYLGTVYGAGQGLDTWSEYTEVNLNSGARVYEVYGGGRYGHVLNSESVQRYMDLYKDKPSDQISHDDSKWSKAERWKDGVVGGTLKDGKLHEDDMKTIKEEWADDWADAWTLGGYFAPDEDGDYNFTSKYVNNKLTNLTNTGMVRNAEMDDRDFTGYASEALSRNENKYNTNVLIHEGAEVVNYAYGGGWGEVSQLRSGDIYGSTYIALLGGTVKKDIYAAGTAGSVDDIFGVKAYNVDTNHYGFTASANAFIKGGTVRNVYGGGWEGSVGKHTKLVTEDGKTEEVNAGLTDPYTDDIPGETHVVIGCLEEDIYKDSTEYANQGILKHGFYYGRPTVQRNAYGGGEGGAVYGTAYVKLRNGYVGYQFNPSITDNQDTAGFDERYEEKIEDETYKNKDGHFESNSNLYDSGCIFGGGYIDNSNVDNTMVTMQGGHVRNSLFGGGEIAAIGRGVINASGTNNTVRTLQGIYKAGKTKVELYEGHVHRNVFGGGRGYNNLGEHGTLYSDGFVFGQTEVNIFGGEVGTLAGVAQEYGNVFGGGDVGYVYSAYELSDGTLAFGKKPAGSKRYDDGDEGYYYKSNGTDFIDDDGTVLASNAEKILTEDCKVLIEPHCKVIADHPDAEYGGIDLDVHYDKGEYVPTSSLNYLENKNLDATKWACLDPTGIKIHNAVFAGGNTSVGSTTAYANATSVYGNATASIHDVYHRDLITLGTGHVGGLYGDGNLTFVDGYRGLNITNYGTDYYYIKDEIDIDTYHALPEREAAYYELKYKCINPCTDKDGTRYNPASDDGKTKASTITMDDMMVVFMEDKTHSVEVDGSGNRVPIGTGTPILIEGTGADKGKWTPNTAYWKENGVLPVYAGRLMNSIQRADFCGVFGSRMVMQGAQDRVPEIVDFTHYTINRVREVSLNQQHSKIDSDLTLKQGKTKVTSNFPNDQHPDDFADLNKAIHGNYFGIYNIVNYLGALTSDVHFMKDKDTRRTENASNNDLYKSPITIGDNTYNYGDAGATYYNWKSVHVKDRSRNNGSSLNKVALASGVYLELTSEKSTGDGLYEKDWGPITGVVELDLINVQPGIGGGFVYAKNEHGIPSYTPRAHATLTALNADAVTRKDFTYDETEGTKKEWQTSGNFVHSTQTIIDDCYNISSKYKTNYQAPGGVPAHYWFIKGSVYVYDQYISAYTGAPNAYSETVEIPLTITAASYGKMKLLNVQPNLYAYYSTPGNELGDDQKVNINDVTYSKNDPISYWDYYLLSNSEKQLFVEKTYVVVDSCYLGGNFYPEGYVMLPSEYNDLRDIAVRNNHLLPTNEPAVQKATLDANGNKIVVTDEDNKPVYEAFEFAFRESNNVGHDTGYLLTYKVNNPTEWDTWYTKFDSSTQEKDQTGGTGYNNGPTYRLISATGEVLGQQEYKVGNLISDEVYYTYNGKEGNANYPGITSHLTDEEKAKQASFEPAYLVTKQFTYTDDTGTYHMNPGSTVSKTVGTANSGSTSPAYICTSTIQLSETEFIYVNSKMTATEKQDYIDRFTTSNPTLAAEIEKNIVPAYYCTEAGRYGGNYYESGKNYRGLEAWSSMSENDRAKFIFNYDAFDLLIDSQFSNAEGQKYQYDGKDADGNDFDTEEEANTNPAGYSVQKSVNYTATYNGTSLTYTTDKGLSATATSGTELSRTEYERLTNEQRHYSPVTPRATDDYKVYVVNTAFQVGNSPYAAGQTISSSEYNSLSDQSYVTVLQFRSEDANETFYYCRDSYKATTTVTNAEDDQHNSRVTATVGGTTTDCTKTGTYDSSTADVPEGMVIAAKTYRGLINNQKNFTIHGISPTEVSTLYVSRESDIFDLSTEKIITVIYQYDYEEVDNSGGVTPISERHVVNIHLQFKSGIPEIEDIKTPPIIFPGDKLSMRDPNVKPGAYTVTGGGWELFERISDAENHTNGIDYVPEENKLYWYQNDWYMAYYAKTYLGKTYSNFVPVSVANYHDLKDVMEAKEHHYYVDIPEAHRLRDPKIYINDYSKDEKNGLDLLKNLFDLSVLDSSSPEVTSGVVTTEGPLKDHALLNSHVEGAQNLEFFLRTDIDHSGSAWTSIGTIPVDDDSSTTDVDETVVGTCFGGTLHGDGHHLKGLSSSLFNNLCGDVYNLGVSGTFTGAGIAEMGSGYVENCWVSTSSTAAKTSSQKPVFGNPTIEANTTRPNRIVNCYYEEEDGATNAYTNHSGSYGIPTKKPKQAFYNGEVAYDLNGFYLYKRYCDNAGGTLTNAYKYWKPGETDPQTGYYGTDDGTLCSSGSNRTVTYVEDRFEDGDFIYANHEIPEDPDVRLYTDGDGKTAYCPIWPDDYLFFGQDLSYGHVTERTHQDYPSGMTAANRVYRAPAYFRSSNMSMAHFNADAVFAKSKKDDPAVVAYKNMTAIDFTGHNDVTYAYEKGWSNWSVTSQTPQTTEMSADKYAFYPPLLDDEGLTSFRNIDLTQNLLAYTSATGGTGSGQTPTAAQQTANAVSKALTDEAYAERTPEAYHSVAFRDATNVKGHQVQLTGSTYQAQRDHFLVDKQDFNAPIGYSFAAGKRMWYQRKPDNYVGKLKDDQGNYRKDAGWEAVSLPFKAELVTTNSKGEITHFYGDSRESRNDTGSKIGHEYWLREFKGGSLSTSDTQLFEADFNYPAASLADGLKEYTNTFLWDTYYSFSEYDDQNLDDYQENDDTHKYYSEAHNMYNYPRIAQAMPYIIGFPGERYYEFDLSGQFSPSNTKSWNHSRDADLELTSPQTITFASKPGETTIAVSDTEIKKMMDEITTHNGYTFKPSYLNETFVAGTTYTYTLNADGSRFDIIPAAPDPSDAEAAPVADTQVYAFRPFFKAVSPSRQDTRSIVFAQNQEMGKTPTLQKRGILSSRAGNHKIVVSSTLDYAADVTITNTAGQTLATFTLQPGETVETRINLFGVYIVQSTSARYTRKLAVK